MKYLAKEANAPRAWTLLGATGALAGLLILSFYSVAAGWAMAYMFSWIPRNCQHKELGMIFKDS